MSVVRPFRSRVVRPDRAEGIATPMSDPLEQALPDQRAPRAFDPEAYDESAAALLVYRQRRGAESYTGVVCEVSAEAFENGQVRGHEAVRPERVEALVRHFATTPDRPAMVALLHRAGPVATRTVAAVCRTSPMLDFSGPDGFEQTLWRVPEGPDTAALAEELSAVGHYIADGHHRVSACIEGWLLAGEPASAGLLCVAYPMDGLRLSAFHRRVRGPVVPDNLLEVLSQDFDVREVGSPPTPVAGCLGIYVGRRWFEARFQGVREDGPAGLDVAVLHTRVLQKLGGPQSGPEVEFTPARTSHTQLAGRCDQDGGALFTLAPPALEVITGLADGGEVMPPKTTYFEPKPYTGIVLPS